MERAITPTSPGVSIGYLVAGALAAALWLGVGLILLPLMLGMALLHGLAGGHDDAIARSHHRWLARHHLWAVVVLILALIAPLFALPTLLNTLMTVLNTLAYAPHPWETLAVAWPELGMGTLLAAGFTLVIGWLVATLWISIRLIRRGLRWAESQPA